MSASPSSEPFRGYRTAVRPEWLDYNHHMNDAAYAIVCTEANEAFLEALGLSSSYERERGMAMYTVEAHLRYLAEVGPDRQLTAETVVVDADTKRLRLHTAVLDEAAVTVVTGEYLYLHMNRHTGRVSPFPDDRSVVVQEALRAHAGWPRPHHLGLGVGAPR